MSNAHSAGKLFCKKNKDNINIYISTITVRWTKVGFKTININLFAYNFQTVYIIFCYI